MGRLGDDDCLEMGRLGGGYLGGGALAAAAQTLAVLALALLAALGAVADLDLALGDDVGDAPGVRARDLRLELPRPGPADALVLPLEGVLAVLAVGAVADQRLHAGPQRLVVAAAVAPLAAQHGGVGGERGGGQVVRVLGVAERGAPGEAALGEGRGGGGLQVGVQLLAV